MSWQQPSSDLVRNGFTPAEFATLKNIRGETTDQFAADELTRVIAEIRDAIRGGGYELAEGDTLLPLGLHDTAIHIARWRCLADFPGLEKLKTKERSEANAAALKVLEQLRASKYPVEPPTGGGSPSAKAFTTERLKGRMGT